jgi:hypothetical protein
VPAHGPGQPPTFVVRAGNTGTTLFFGFFVLLWAGILTGIEVHGPPTTGDRIAAGAVFGFLILLTGVLWRLFNGNRSSLEIRRTSIVSQSVFQDGNRGQRAQRVDRADGDTLRLLPKYKLYGHVRPPRLMFVGRGEFILLKRPLENSFSFAKVQRACAAHGWPFEGDTSAAVKDVQDWLHQGRSVEAVQLLELFGPFPAAGTDDQPHVALTAAVFEDVGDKLIPNRGRRDNARDAYRRAAVAQRAFAGYTRSPEETAARLAEASRIDAKAQA